MKILTVENIVNALQATLVNGDEYKEKVLEGAAIDSRKVEKDNLFFAIKGDKVDGHDFIKAAFDNGAGAVICERVPDGEEGICIVVEDTVEALKKLASFYREQLGIKVVGVTGSIGKTTTKEFIATVLSQKYNVFRTEKNQNNLIGLPLSILNIKENNEVAVLEMGISEFGEMTKLSEIAKPDICVITNISACHLETLGSLDGVFKAKTEIFEHMNPEGDVCVCGDDERLSTLGEVKGKKVVTFGFDEKNEVHPTKIVNRGLWGSECTIENGDGIFNISVPLAGKHMIMDALAAISVAKILDVSAEQVSFGISCVKALAGRNNIIQKNSITILDDCYNASPESMKSALDLLTEAITPTVAILGDMFEQGENEDRGHEEIGQYAVEKGINTIVCVGTLSKKMYDKAQSEASVKENIDVLYYATVDEAIADLPKYVKKDDTVLIKASNGMKFNRILEAITDDKIQFENREERLFKRPSVVNANLDEVMSEIKNVGAKKEEEQNTDNTEASGTPEAGETKNVKAKPEKSADQKEKEGARKQLIAIICAAAAVILIGAAAFGIVRYNRYKDATQGIVVYLDGTKYETKGLIEDGVIAVTEDGVVWNNGNQNVAMGYDGKNFFYAVPDGGNFELFVCDKNGKNKKSVAKTVRRYDILKKDNIIFISGNALYTYNVKKDETNLVAEEVLRYSLNEKKNEVVYYTFSGGLYYMKTGDPETLVLLDENVTSFEYADPKLKNIIYYKNNGLYVCKRGKENIFIAPEADNLYIAEKEKTTKIYYSDEESKLYYFNVKDSEPKTVTDNATSVFGMAYGYASLMSMDSNGVWKYIKDDKIYELKDFSVGRSMQVVGADKKNLYFINIDAITNVGSLYSISDKGFSKQKKPVLESSNVSSAEYIGEGKIFVNKTDGGGNNDLYEREKLIARNVEPGSLKKTEFGKYYVFAYQVSDTDGFYKIVLYNGNTIKEIGSSIDLDVVALSKRKVYFRTKSDVMFDIKYFNGSKVKSYKENVSEFKYIQY